MSTPLVSLRSPQGSDPSTPHSSFGSRLWENLTFSFSDNTSTVLKVVGVAIVIWLFGFACGVHCSRLQSSTIAQKPSQVNTETAPSSASFPTQSSNVIAEPIAPSSPQIQKEDGKKPLPHGIKEENVQLCLQYIRDNPASGEKMDDGGQTVEGYQARIPGFRLAEFTQGVQESGRYDHFLGYLVEQKHIKNYKVFPRNHETVIWL